MLRIESGVYSPPFWLPNGDLQTIYPALFRKIVDVVYCRERINTPDSDFLDIDWVYSKGSTSAGQNALVVLSHGLEGSTASQYMKGMCRTLSRAGFDCLAWNFRGCSEVLNKTYRFYHSGATEDLDCVINHQ